MAYREERRDSMNMTDVFVAVCGTAAQAAPFGLDCRLRQEDEDELIKDVMAQHGGNILVLAFVRDRAVAKILSKVMLSTFAESVSSSKYGYTAFRIAFVKEAVEDLIQYRCERFSDIDAVVEFENGAHSCVSLRATGVQPYESTFHFVEQRLTFLACYGSSEYTARNLEQQIQSVAAILGSHVASICVYLPMSEMRNPIPFDSLSTEVSILKERVRCRSVGRNEVASSRERLQDVRAWSLMVNEQHHFSPLEQGPYFISLNPQLTVGEKLAHCVREGCSYIMGESTNASPLDFCVTASYADGDPSQRSLYSPHCRIRREGTAVWLKSEGGMSYVNGKLLSQEKLLQHNDRITLGTHLAFRFVQVGTEVSRATGSQILDWEFSSKEFWKEGTQVIESGTMAALERDKDELRARCADLETQLLNARGDAWVMLTNPPSFYRGTVLWPLDLRASHCRATIGPHGDVRLPFLSRSAVIEHSTGGLVLRCSGATFPLSSGSRFAVGSATFFLSLEDVAPVRAQKGSTSLDVSAEDLQEMQSSYFSLQWSVGALFDFVFPMKGRRLRPEVDGYATYRSRLYDTQILESSDLQLNDIAVQNTQLTAAVRLIAAGIAKQLHDPLPPSALVQEVSSSHSNTVRSANKVTFLKSALSSAPLSAAVLDRLHEDIGAALMESCEGFTQQSEKLARSASRERSQDNAALAASFLSTVQDKLGRLKGTCFVASSAVMRRASTTVDLLDISTGVKVQWERHVQLLETMGTSFLVKKGEDANLLKELLFLIVDALISTDFCVRRNLLSQKDLEELVKRMAHWQKWADKCVCAFENCAPASRVAWKHEATLQRKPTPHLRRQARHFHRGSSACLHQLSVTTGNASQDQKRHRPMRNDALLPPALDAMDLVSQHAPFSRTYTYQPLLSHHFSPHRRSSVPPQIHSAAGTSLLHRISSAVPHSTSKTVKKRPSQRNSPATEIPVASGCRKAANPSKGRKL